MCSSHVGLLQVEFPLSEKYKSRFSGALILFGLLILREAPGGRGDEAGKSPSPPYCPGLAVSAKSRQSSEKELTSKFVDQLIMYTGLLREKIFDVYREFQRIISAKKV